MRKLFFAACMSLAFLTASAQSNPYIVKTKGASKSASNHMADMIAAAMKEDEAGTVDFVSKNFKYQSLCDWQKGMKFMVMPDKYDLVVKTFVDAATDKMVSNLKLKYKIMIYQGHDESMDGHVHINFICQDDNKAYFYEISHGSFNDYCFQKNGVPTLAYLGDVDVAREKLLNKVVYTKTRYYRMDTEYDGEGYETVEVDPDTEVKVVAVGVGTRSCPVKIIVEDKEGNQFYQNIAMSKTNSGMRDDEFSGEYASYLFNNSFELQDDVMSITSKNYKMFLGKLVHTKFPMRMLNEVTRKQQAIPRHAEYEIELITPHKSDDMATIKLKNTTLGTFFYTDCYIDQFKCADQPDKFFGALFAPGPGKNVETSEASRAMLRGGHVGIGMSEDETQMAAGEPDMVEPGSAGHYFWIFQRSNNKLLYVEFDGSGFVKQTSVKDGTIEELKAGKANQQNNKNGKKSKGKTKAKKDAVEGVKKNGTPLE